MKIDRDAPIGVFDSGVGGLTVAREIMRNLPSEKIVYFGDTARVPYGSKSKETIIRYSRQIIHFLREQQVKAIVIACNTASAFALDAVKDELDISSSGTGEEEFPYRFYVSDLADEFKDFANSILPYDVSMAKKIDIEKY